MPVRKGLDSSLSDFRFVVFDAAARGDYFAVFLLLDGEVCYGLLCRIYDGVVRFPGGFLATLYCGAVACIVDGNTLVAVAGICRPARARR